MTIYLSIDMKKKRRVGRPRTRQPDLLVFNTQMTAKAKTRLKALAQLEGIPSYILLEKAFWQCWESLSPDRREGAEQIASIIEDAQRVLSE